MRAHQFCGPEHLRLQDAPGPQVQAGQVQIKVCAARINPADLVHLLGRLGTPPLPYIPGTDVCGEVEAGTQAISLPANLSREEGTEQSCSNVAKRTAMPRY
jgi:NADPH:quinone reductase-like Zn-dependent oxidoreductase